MKIYLNPFRVNRWIRALIVILFIKPISFIVGFTFGIVLGIFEYFPSDEVLDPLMALVILGLIIWFVAHPTKKSKPKIVDAEYEEIIVLTDLVEASNKKE